MFVCILENEETFVPCSASKIWVVIVQNFHVIKFSFFQVPTDLLNELEFNSHEQQTTISRSVLVGGLGSTRTYFHNLKTVYRRMQNFLHDGNYLVIDYYVVRDLQFHACKIMLNATVLFLSIPQNMIRHPSNRIYRYFGKDQV